MSLLLGCMSRCIIPVVNEHLPRLLVPFLRQFPFFCAELRMSCLHMDHKLVFVDPAIDG